jgi:hypothetical protein
MIECPPCGAELAPRSRDGLYYDSDELTCECGAVALVSFDEGDDEPWVNHWRCKHGHDGETPCAACDLEERSA